MENIFRNGHFIKKYRGEKAITSVMEIPAEPVKSLFAQILDGTVESISEADFDENLTKICDYSLYYLPNIQTIKIPNQITNIGRYCLAECDSLKSVILGSGITSIGEYFCQNSSTLTTLTIFATTPPAAGPTLFSGVSTLEAIYVPSESVATYKSATYWSNYADKIQAIV